MRLTLTAFGIELDVTLGKPQDEQTDQRGDVLSTPVGFTRAEVPWEDSGSLHQFEPEECRG